MEVKNHEEETLHSSGSSSDFVANFQHKPTLNCVGGAFTA